jgi:hypothetical protein
MQRLRWQKLSVEMRVWLHRLHTASLVCACLSLHMEAGYNLLALPVLYYGMKFIKIKSASRKFASVVMFGNLAWQLHTI